MKSICNKSGKKPKRWLWILSIRSLLEEKKKTRQKDERVKPLAAYRAAELQKMKINFSGKFYGGEVNYHEARYNFVHKVRPKETAAYLAKHMRLDAAKLSELRQPLTY